MSWQSLFLRTDSLADNLADSRAESQTTEIIDQAAVVAALLDTAQRCGYERYDPFTGGSGTPPRLKTLDRKSVV